MATRRRPGSLRAASSPDAGLPPPGWSASASPHAAPPAAGNPAESPAMPQSPGRAVFGPSMPHLSVAPGDGIDATFMPRIAAQDALRRQGRAADRAMDTQRIHRILAAAWPEPAVRADQGTQRPLIDA